VNTAAALTNSNHNTTTTSSSSSSSSSSSITTTRSKTATITPITTSITYYPQTLKNFVLKLILHFEMSSANQVLVV